MATVTLTDIWLNDASDPSDSMAFSYVGDSYSIAETVGGGVEGGYASGRTRVYSTDDDTTSVQFGLQWVTAAQRDWLRAHRGLPVCFRDPRGFKVFGAFHTLPQEFSTMPVAEAVDSASITLSSVTFDESV